MGRTRKDNEGMTLLEVTFAASVLALALAMLFGSLLNLRVIGQTSADRSVALAQLASVMEEIRGLPLNELMQYTQPEFSGPGTKQAVLIEAFDTDGDPVPMPVKPDALGVLNLPGANTFPNPLEIKVTFAWSDTAGRVYSVRATTGVAR